MRHKLTSTVEAYIQADDELRTMFFAVDEMGEAWAKFNHLVTEDDRDQFREMVATVGDRIMARVMEKIRENQVKNSN